jgi:hypothetical protein
VRSGGAQRKIEASAGAGREERLSEARNSVFVVGGLQAVPVNRGWYRKLVFQNHVERPIDGGDDSLLAVGLQQAQHLGWFAADFEHARDGLQHDGRWRAFAVGQERAERRAAAAEHSAADASRCRNDKRTPR